MFKAFKLDLGNGYERIKTYVGEEVTGFNREGTKEVVFVPEKTIANYVRCAVTGLRLQTMQEQRTLRSYAATAIKAVGVYYEANTNHEDNPMVIIQNKDLKWFALRLCGDRLEVSAIEDEFNPYDICDGWEQPFDKDEIGGWRYLTVNQSQSTNKRLMSIVDWFLMR